MDDFVDAQRICSVIILVTVQHHLQFYRPQRAADMDMIKIRSCLSQDVTIISNDFLDRFLPEANGEFIKI